MAEMKARERHVAEIERTRAELDRLKKDTPHRRDVDRHLKRLVRELLIYDRYRGRSNTWQDVRKLNMTSSSSST